MITCIHIHNKIIIMELCHNWTTYPTHNHFRFLVPELIQLPMQRDKERWFPPQGQLEMLEPGWLEVSSKNYLNNS